MKMNQNNLLKSGSALSVRMLALVAITILLQSCSSVFNHNQFKQDDSLRSVGGFRVTHKSSSLNLF